MLSILELASKTTMLILLATGCRKRELLGLHLDHMTCFMDKTVFNQQYLSKTFTSKSGNYDCMILTITSNPNIKLCPVYHLSTYINRTASQRTTRSVFISSTPPYDQISGQCLSNWIKLPFKQAGLLPQKSSLQSTRSVVSSTMFQQGVPLNQILAHCKWSSGSVFYRHYFHHMPTMTDASYRQLCTEALKGHRMAPAKLTKRPLSLLDRPLCPVGSLPFSSSSHHFFVR